MRVSTMPMDMCPTWFSTIGQASFSVPLSSSRREMRVPSMVKEILRAGDHRTVSRAWF